MSHSFHLQDESLRETRSSSTSPPGRGSVVVVFCSGLGKRQSRESTVTPGINQVISSITESAQGSLSGYCHRLHRLFLVDSGADVSVYPAGVEDRRLPPSSSLTAANGTRIDTYGRRELELCFPGLKTRHVFILALVRSPILGADFFLQNGLVIDIPKRRIYSDSVCVKARPAQVISDLCGLTCGRPSVSEVVPSSSIANVLDQFPAVMTPAPTYDSSRPCLLYTSPSPRDS